MHRQDNAARDLQRREPDRLHPRIHTHARLWNQAIWELILRPSAVRSQVTYFLWRTSPGGPATTSRLPDGRPPDGRPPDRRPPEISAPFRNAVHEIAA